MEHIIVASALYLMPIFSFIFIFLLISLVVDIKNNQPIKEKAFGASIFFGLMMWTLSATILLSNG